MASERLSCTSVKRHAIQWILGLLAIWVIAVGVMTVFAANDARLGQRALSTVASQSSLGEIQDATFDQSLQDGAESLRRTHSLLASPVYWPLLPVPWVGTQLRASRQLADSGSRASYIVLDVSRQARILTQGPIADRAAILQALGELCTKNDEALLRLDLGPKSGLIRPLQNAHEKAAGNLNRLDEGLGQGGAAASALGTLLSTDENYLLVAANNAEMRSGSGMFLSVGLLQSTNHKLVVGDMRSVGEIPSKTGISWPGQYDANWGWLGHESDFRNLMLSPRYDVSAPIAKDIWQKAGGPQVAGVVTMDVPLLKALLEATGPVQAGGVSISTSNVEKTLLFDQYVNVDAASKSNVQRRDALAGIAKAVFEAFNNDDLDVFTTARQLATAAAGRHLLVWSDDESRNRQWQEAGVGGALGPDDTMLSVINLGTNKLDQFLKIDAVMSTTQQQNALDTTIDVTIANTSPASGPKYIMGPVAGSGLSAGEYQGVLAFSLPQDVTHAAWNNDLDMAIAGEDGETVRAGTRIDIKQGETQTFTLTFSRLADASGTTILPSARVPGVTWHYDGDVWTDDHSRILEY